MRSILGNIGRVLFAIRRKFAEINSRVVHLRGPFWNSDRYGTNQNAPFYGGPVQPYNELQFLLTQLARSVLWNVSLPSFLHGPRNSRSVQPRLRANIPQCVLPTLLVRSLKYDWIYENGVEKKCGPSHRVSYTLKFEGSSKPKNHPKRWKKDKTNRNRKRPEVKQNNQVEE